jgi:hypothetical protein
MSRLDRAEIADSSPDREGYVYCLCHICMPGIIKIGATRKHPIARATELSMGTGVPGAFTVSYYCSAPDAFDVEGAVHEAFKEQRVDEGREFFSCGLDEAIAFIRHYVQDTYGEVGQEGGEWVDEGWSGEPYPITSFAELFATFPDDGGDRELTEDEAEQCRKLARSLVKV